MKRCLAMHEKVLMLLLFAGLAVVSSAQQPKEDTGGLPGIFGVFGMRAKLTVDPDGFLNIITDEKNGRLVSIVAQKNVRLDAKDRDLYLSCDRLLYEGKDNKLIATGQPVHIKTRATEATCGHFEYFPETRRSELSINPVIYNEDAEGRRTTSTGGLVIIDQDEQGMSSILIKGDGKVPVELVLAPVEKPSTEDQVSTPTAPVKIDKTNVNEIKEMEVTE
jgi:hypothetical protein